MRCLSLCSIALLTLVLAACGGSSKAQPSTTTHPAAPSVSLSIGAGNAKQTLTRCGDRDPYASFRRGARVVIRGAVHPPPSAESWSIAIRRKKCSGGTWTGNLGDIVVAGKPDGSFRTVYTAEQPGAFSVHAIYAAGGQRVNSDTYHLIVQ